MHCTMEEVVSHVAVLLNTKAGALGHGIAGPEDVQKAFADAGVRATVEVISPERLKQQAEDAASSGVEAVIAGGGDGTVGTVAAVLIERGVPLGVLPLGTRNHFARDLQIPEGLAEAVQVVRDAAPRPVDVGEVNDRVFINNASIGLYPDIVRARESNDRSRPLVKAAATAWAAAKVLRRFRLMRVRLQVDGQSVVRTTPFVFVGNNEYQMSLFSLGLRQCLDKGTLSLYTAQVARRSQLLRLGTAALLDRLEQARDFDLRCVDELWLDAHTRHMRVAVDGEVVLMPPPLHFRARRGALRVLAPPAPER
jgi:diacylglycerol kinase family enzyme